MVLRAASLLADAVEAEDLVQETMLRAFNGLEQFRPDSQGRGIKAWLLRILHNVHLDRLRYARRRPDLTHRSEDSEVGDQAAAGPAEPKRESTAQDLESLLEQFSDEALIAVIRKLPVELAWTLLLVDVEELDHADAAVVMGVPMGTVKSRAFRGRRLLRQRLETAHAGRERGP